MDNRFMRQLSRVYHNTINMKNKKAGANGMSQIAEEQELLHDDLQSSDAFVIDAESQKLFMEQLEK